MEKGNSTNILFSFLNGNNYYKVNTFSNDKADAEHCNNLIPVDIVYCNSLIDTKLWKRYIENPPVQKYLFWPIDVVEMCNNDSLKTYGNMGLVFSKKALPKIETLKSFVWNESKIGLENEAVIKIACNLLSILIDLEEAGYIYNSFDLERIYYDPNTLEVYINFALSTTIKKSDLSKKSVMLHNDISVDFLPPWNKNGTKDDYVNSNQHRFSIAVLLFKMLIGRMPYQGRLFDGYGNILDYRRDTDKMLHKKAMEAYLDIDIFIFDNDIKENYIGTFTTEQKQISRWNSLNENIRDMFYKTFSLSCCSEENQNLYSYQEWLKAISNI